MEENEDNSSIKSPVIEIDAVEKQEFKATNECDAVVEKSNDFECVGDVSKPLIEEASISVSVSQNLVEDCVAVAEESDDKFSDGVVKAEGFKSKDDSKPLIEATETQNLIKECAVVEEESDSKFGDGLVADVAKAEGLERKYDLEKPVIEATETRNLEEDCVEEESNNEFSVGVVADVAKAEGLERKDEVISEIEASVVGVDASGVEVREVVGDIEAVAEVVVEDVCVKVETETEDGLEDNDMSKAANEGEVEGGVDEEEKLGDNDHVKAKDARESGFDGKQDVCVEVEAEKKDESEVEGDMDEAVELGDIVGSDVVHDREMKDEVGVELETTAVCEDVNEECKGDCETEVVAEAFCEVRSEVENKSEIGIETEMKVRLEVDKNDDDVVEEEKVGMGFAESECVNEEEEMAAKLEDNAEPVSGLISVAEDTVMEDKNLVMESEIKKRDDEMESAPESGDEEDEMETEREADGDKVEGEAPQPDDDSQLGEDEEDERLVGDEEVPAADVEMETETDAGDSIKISGGKRKRGKNTKAAGKAQLLNMVGLPVEEEDVCFVCFDGGDLVLCDRKYVVLVIIICFLM